MIKELLRDKNTFATPVVLYLFQDLGNDALTFEPETIGDRMRMIEPKTPQALIDRVNAALGLYNSDLFWTDPVIFGIVCRSLNRRKYPGADEPTIGDICWGVTEATLLTNDSDTETPSNIFSDSIIKYVKYSLKLNAIYTTPKSLQSDFGDMSFEYVVDDPAIAEARQHEFDADADKIDAIVARKLHQLLLQIKRSGVKLTNSASDDVDKLLQEYNKQPN